MMYKWIPWKYLIRRMARAHGFLDPMLLMARLQNFAQPSEVAEPIELLRAGIIFHARGLINTKAIQNNLDWIWPFWVERQFNPRDPAFIPRAFSVSHVNLSHRNWTALGVPNCPFLPIVDPSGLVTPFYNGWSLDAWIVSQDNASLIPSKLKEIGQTLVLGPDSLVLETEAVHDGFRLFSRAEVVLEKDAPFCQISYRAHSEKPAWLALSVRPYNPEGISFIQSIAISADRRSWTVNDEKCVFFNQPAEEHLISSYHQGDVFHRIPKQGGTEEASVKCKVELATAAALFRLDGKKDREVSLKVALSSDRETPVQFPGPYTVLSWKDSQQGLSELKVPDARFMFLYESALRTLILHSPGEVVPGPYTYKRFWFRDAAFILNAMLGVGMTRRAEICLDLFPGKQKLTGYFLSQEGEWDSNGEALWILHRYCQLTGTEPKESWKQAIQRGGHWIGRKRIRGRPDAPENGLLPAGFSAEHLGPNDYYYWDDFWAVAGLRSAAKMLDSLQDPQTAKAFREEADDFMLSIHSSLEKADALNTNPSGGIPASPYRRMDSGAIGSIVAGYPLDLWPARNSRLLSTLDFLMDKCRVRGGFFQDMIHSGINAYLTLHMAQVLLRAGDPRFFGLIKDTADLASPTGQWPEAIHPHTLGGCMGDGQHVWAAAEWVLMMRSLFVREEDDRLILASGIPKEWLNRKVEMSFGPTPTRFGPVTVTVRPGADKPEVEWTGQWHSTPPQIVVRLPGQVTTAIPTTANNRNT